MSDMVERLRDARSWLNNGDCCGDKDSAGICAAPACIFGEALKELYEAADEIARLREAMEEYVNTVVKMEGVTFVEYMENAELRAVVESILVEKEK